jgi:hypothetical protein
MTYQMRIRAVLCWSAGTDSEAGLAKRRRTSLLPDTSARSALSSRSSDYREDCGLTPVGAETLRTSCGLLIFVEEAAEAVVSLDLVDLGPRGGGVVVRERPGPGRGAADDDCSGAGTRAARLRHVVG